MVDSTSLDAHAARLQVINEIVAGDGLTMGQAAALLPAHRGEGTATASRVWRWATAGQKREGGKVVKLETATFGNQRLTSRAALARFAAALSALTTDDNPPSTCTPSPQKPEGAPHER